MMPAFSPFRALLAAAGLLLTAWPAAAQQPAASSFVNLDPKNALTLETALPGVSFETVTGRVLISASVSDYNTFNNPNTVQLAAFTDARKKGNRLAVTLPAKSVVVREEK